jgi:DNA polymerase-3 subunit delta
VLQQLQAAIFPDAAAAAWSREVLHADAVTAEVLVTAGLALPLLGGRRLAIVRGLGSAPAKTIDRLRAAIETARKERGGWPVEGTTVALLAPGADRKSPALRLVPDSEQVEVRPPAGRALPGWLRARAKGLGLDLTPSAAETLLGLAGEDLTRLAGELEKAAVFAGPDARVTDEVVRALVGESRVRRFWELTQALEDADAVKALRVLDQLLAAGEEPTVLLYQIVGHVRDLWRAKAGVDERRDARDLGALFRGRPSFAVERLLARAATVSPEALDEAVRGCFDVELRLKSGGGDASALLTTLVVGLARR